MPKIGEEAGLTSRRREKLGAHYAHVTIRHATNSGINPQV